MDSYVVFRLYAIQTILFEWDRVLQHCDEVEYVVWCRLDEESRAKSQESRLAK
jgi:hypothetical protein